jgi:hypothetical protein
MGQAALLELLILYTEPVSLCQRREQAGLGMSAGRKQSRPEKIGVRFGGAVAT